MAKNDCPTLNLLKPYQRGEWGNEGMEERGLGKAIFIAEKGLSFGIIKKSRIFPPLDILNSFLRCGVDDAASEISIHWEPFYLTECEYDKFVEHCKASMGQFEIDGLGMDDYAGWFSEAALRERY